MSKYDVFAAFLFYFDCSAPIEFKDHNGYLETSCIDKGKSLFSFSLKSRQNVEGPENRENNFCMQRRFERNVKRFKIYFPVTKFNQ